MDDSKQKRITLRAVYGLIQDLAIKIDTSITDQINELARMVAANFNAHTERFTRIEARLTDLEFGQQVMNAKLDNMAYSFDVVDLHRRVEVLERKGKVGK
jgi:hypothetical protein